MRLLLSLALAAMAFSAPGSLLAGEHNLTVSDDKGEYAYKPQFKLGDWTLAPAARAGFLALTETFPYPYPILERSPFGMVGFTAAYEGVVDVMASYTQGYADVHTVRRPGGGGSSANHSDADRFSQGVVAQSWYVDVGKTFEVGTWKAAVFAAADQFTFSRPGGGLMGRESMTETNVGTAWMKPTGEGELSLYGDVAYELARKKFYRNDDDYELVPSGTLGIEYGHKGGWRAGLEAQTSRADDAGLALLGYRNSTVALESRRSKDAFFPDVKALAVQTNHRLSDTLTLGVQARYEEAKYAMAPGPDNDVRVMAMLEWRPDDRLVVQSAKSWGRRREADREAAVLKAKQDADVRAVIRNSPTLDDFLSNYKPGSELAVLEAVGELTRLFNNNNYNESEGSNPNLEGVSEIYERARRSYMDGKDDPILVCLGAAQSAAFVAEELGRLHGLEIQATAVTMQVSDESGKKSGHAVALVRTKDHGLVFVDWGKNTATGTWDTRKALRIYQAEGGQMAIMHHITDPSKDGALVGTLMTEEGKLFVNSLTFHADQPRGDLARMFEHAPRGHHVTVERNRRRLRKPAGQDRP